MSTVTRIGRAGRFFRVGTRHWPLRLTDAGVFCVRQRCFHAPSVVARCEAAESAAPAETPASTEEKERLEKLALDAGIPLDDPGLEDERLDDASRAPEDELAYCQAYFEVLVWHYRAENRIMWKRILRLESPEKLVAVANKFSAMKTAAPELFDHLGPRILARLDEVPSNLLPSLAWSFAVQKRGSSEFWQAIADRVKSTGVDGFSPTARSNLKVALETSKVADKDLMSAL